MENSDRNKFLEVVAIAAIIFLLWRLLRKRRAVVIEEPERPDCKNIMSKPLSPWGPTASRLLGEGWCYKGDGTFFDGTGFGSDYMFKQADEYNLLKTAESLKANNANVVQFRLINTSAAKITSKILNTTQDVKILNGVYDIMIPNTPVAIAATGEDGSSFSANWYPADNADGYYLDVATDSLFTAFVAGYENLDVGDVSAYSVTGLSEATDYYYRVRAYNDAGTTESSNIITINTGYICVTIGTQVWMLHNVDIDLPGSRVYDDDEDNRSIYGGLYNYDLIPAIEAAYPGYHVPSPVEFQKLADYLGGNAVAGGHLKETGTTHFDAPNTGADNSSGFTGLPGGQYSVIPPGFFWKNKWGMYLTTDPPTGGGSDGSRILFYDAASLGTEVDGGQNYESVRLIKD